MTTLRDHASDYLNDLMIQDKAALTIKTYERILIRDYLKSQGDNKLTRASIRAWLLSLQDQKVSTQRTKYAVLCAWCNWLVAEKIIAENPMQGIKRPTLKPEPKGRLTKEQVDSLVAQCPRQGFLGRRDLAIIRLMVGSGLRLHECAKIELADIDTENQVIAVQGKGGKWRAVPYDDDTAKALSRYMNHRNRHADADSPRLWLGTRGPLSMEGIRDMVRRKGDKAGVPVHPHLFRHTAAQNMLDNGVSESSVMQIFGWSSQSMLLHYTRASAQERALREYRDKIK